MSDEREILKNVASFIMPLGILKQNFNLPINK